MRESLKYLQEHYKTHSVSDFNVAVLHAKLGGKEETFSWLEKSYQARETAIIGLKTTPEFQKWHDDARYADLLRRISLQP